MLNWNPLVLVLLKQNLTERKGLMATADTTGSFLALATSILSSAFEHWTRSSTLVHCYLQGEGKTTFPTDHPPPVGGDVAGWRRPRGVGVR